MEGTEKYTGKKSKTLTSKYTVEGYLKARKAARLNKRPSRWYNGNSLLGNDWARFYFLIGA